MDLALNNLQRLICHKTNQLTNQPNIQDYDSFNLTDEIRIREPSIGKTVNY